MALKRKGPVALADIRKPLLRLLQDGRCKGDARPEGGFFVSVVVNYDQQWRTLWKAQHLGYVSSDDGQRLTENGVAFLRAHGIDASTVWELHDATKSTATA